jgi:ABC-type uncharacterized transport system ATPase subunit
MILKINSKLPKAAKVILVIGPAGAGKSNLLKLATGTDIHVGHELQSGIYSE